MWVARATPSDKGDENILPVNFVAITQGLTNTNYQLLPGDRLYIVDDNLVAANNYLNKLDATDRAVVEHVESGYRHGPQHADHGTLFNQNRTGL